jgi:peptidoglycan/LPS O-acetylase OafA/YrhL
MERRLETLDSLRGLAALCVVIHHSLIIRPIWYDDTHHVRSAALANLFKYTPLRIVWAGHEAVMLFFVLSGFVLSLPYLSGRSLPYRAYLAKRFCRIYVPCLVAVTVGILLRQLFVTPHPPGVSHWMDDIWKPPLTLGLFGSYTLLAGSFNLSNFDPVLWSLVHEIRISMLLPLIAAFVLPGPVNGNETTHFLSFCCIRRLTAEIVGGRTG